MKFKKALLSLLLISIMTILFATNSFAAESISAINLKIEEYRQADKSGNRYGYRIEQGETTKKIIWKIAQLNGSQSDFSKTIYCLKAEKGFQNRVNNSNTFQDAYDYRLNMKSSVDRTLGARYLSDVESCYGQVLWILDNAYIKDSSTAAADRVKLLQNAGINSDNWLTDDDIDVVQQLAIWYFTNASDPIYHTDNANGPVLKTLMVDKNNQDNYDALENVLTYRQDDASTLYKYLIRSANENANKYFNSDESLKDLANPISINKDITYSLDSSGNNYIVGPYKINKLDGVEYTNLTATINKSGYTVLDKDKNMTNKDIKDIANEDFYISIPVSSITETTNIKFSVSASYATTNCMFYTKYLGQDSTQPVVIVDRDGKTFSDEVEVTIPVEDPELPFDLSLRKFITNINGTDITNRYPSVDVEGLKNGSDTTAIYNHTKEPITVKAGDIVTYTIRIYNEGQVDGYASLVTDYLPVQLEFIDDEENAAYGWLHTESGDIVDGKVRKIRTDYLAKGGVLDNTEKRTNGSLLKAFDPSTMTTLDYIDLKVKCKVRSDVESGDKITNIAEISNDSDAEGNDITDRDSTPGKVQIPGDENLPGYKDDEISKSYVPGQEDDDDFEKLIIEEFDLSLRKYISKIITGEDEYETIGREPSVDVSKLNSIDADGKKITTATYNHTKIAKDVSKGDIVEYTIRVYNEGSINGYVEEITDYLPKELEYLPEDEENIKYGWKVSEENSRILTTDYLSKEKSESNIINKFNGTDLDYKEVKVRCLVKDTAEYGEKITNIAQITKHMDENGEVTIKDRDSVPNDNLVIPEDKNLPEYKENEISKSYVPGQEDDDDFEKVRVVYFDLALRKFITKVNENDVTNRYPVVTINENPEIKTNRLVYTHTKDPVEVVTEDIVVYTLRIYNEGLMNGYASEITDDVPEGLEYLPENEINKEYGWKLSEDGKKITTEYLSKKNEKNAGDNLIKAFDFYRGISDENPLNPDYKDIKIAFKVTEPNTSDRILVNTAEISNDTDETGNSVNDIDSIPGNNNEWNKEDDLDKEFLKVKYFDLSLKKWVSKVIIIENGKEKVTKTGHTGNENPEPIVKVDLHRKKLNKVTVKFGYTIKITNEGEIAGYAKEITDYIPEGLKFVKADNKNWKQVSDKVITTRALENTLLQPGQSATVEVILTWINGANNVGVKTNTAEISEDYNDSHTPDIDSTPNNKKDGEDDIDTAPVMLAVATGEARIYYTLGTIVLVTVAGGIILIKKYVL